MGHPGALARKAEVPRGTITRLENGERPSISLESLVKIARALEVTPGTLLDMAQLTEEEPLPEPFEVRAERKLDFILATLDQLRLEREVVVRRLARELDLRFPGEDVGGSKASVPERSSRLRKPSDRKARPGA